MARPHDDALHNARDALTGKTGPGEPASRGIPWPGQGPAAFKSRPPVLPNAGPNPNISGDRAMKLIPPLALFNNASQWVNKLFFNRPMTFMQAPDSNPPLRAQYFTPPPIQIANLAAGALNLQLQLGGLTNQAAQLSNDASNYFGS